ncbi:MAG: putative Ig domain-containing protein [Acidobacteria bacterium]|nr:putative Ig domain-containing protein [Acidobacteriota bacterium]
MKVAFLLAITVLQANAQSVPGFTFAPTTLNLSPTRTNQYLAIIPQNAQLPFSYTATASASWITVLPPNGANVTGAKSLLIATTPFGPPSGGDASGTVRLTIGAATQDIVVTFTKGTAGVNGYTISPLILNVPADASRTDRHTVTITPSDLNTVYFTAATISPSGVSWLNADSLLGLGSGKQTLAFTVDPNRAASGSGNTATVRIVIGNQYQDIVVNFRPPPIFIVLPTYINLRSGETRQPVTINPINSIAPFTYSVALDPVPWLSLAAPIPSGPVSGVQTFTVLANPTGLNPGSTYLANGTLTIGTQVWKLLIEFVPPRTRTYPSFQITPDSISIDGGRASQSIVITPTTSEPFQFSAYAEPSYFTVTPASSTSPVSGPQTLTIGSNLVGLWPGTQFRGVVRLSVAGFNANVSVDYISPLSAYSNFTIDQSRLGIGLNPSTSFQRITFTPNHSRPYSLSTSIETTPGENWLSVTPTSTEPASGPQSLIVWGNPFGLLPATSHRATLTVTDGAETIRFPVTYFTPLIIPTQATCAFTPQSVLLSIEQPEATITLTTTSALPAVFSTSIDHLGDLPWLRSEPSEGTLTGPAPIRIFTTSPTGSGRNAVFRASVLNGPDCTVPVTFDPYPPLTFSTTALPSGTLNQAYSFAVQRKGGKPPLHWNQDGQPAGLTIDPNTGVISGTPTQSGAFTVRVTVVDDAFRTSVTYLPLSIQPSAPPKLSFVPLKPCRIVETRAAYNFEGRTTPFGPPFFAANETRTLTLPASNVCEIPEAAAYVLNVTAIPRSPLDYITVYAADEVQPDLRTVSSPDSQTVANTAIVRAGPGGTIKVFATNSTDMIIDIAGYFTATASSRNLAFYPVTPCRAVETRGEYRNPAGPFGPPMLNTRETRRFRVPASPFCTIPANASAYSATVTVVPPGPLPYLTLWPAGEAQPNVSSINSFAGRVLANNVIVPAGAEGNIDVFAYERTDLLIDINGYFAPANGPSGLSYTPVIPCSLTGSNGVALATESSATLSPSQCSVPTGAKAYLVHFTARPGGSSMPFLTAYPTGQPRPNTSVLNAFQGQTVTNSAIIPAGTNGGIDIYAYRATNVIGTLTGYFW